MRYDVEKLYCDNCNKELRDELVYYGDLGTNFCEECGEDILVHNDSIDAYILPEDDRDVIFDDMLSNIEIFTREVID